MSFIHELLHKNRFLHYFDTAKFEMSSHLTHKHAMNLPIQSLQNRISKEELNAVIAPIEHARGMPNASYTDREFFDFERDYIFAKNWSAITFVHNIENGTAKPIDFMGLPIFITRSIDGAIQVFHNVCSHRGMKLVKEERKTNGLIVCQYHSWTYSVAGELKATPHIGGVGVHQVDGFSCKGRGLKPIRFHIWLGILFINLDGNATSFEQDAAPVLERYKKLMGASGEKLINVPSRYSSMSMGVQCNWKLAIENYLEAYHLPFIHPGLNSYSPLAKHSAEIFSTKSAGQVTSAFEPDLGTETALPLFPDWDKDQLQVSEYPAIYPNLLMGFQANHLFAMIVHPTGPSTCHEEVNLYYAGDEINQEKFLGPLQINLETWQEVFNEDIEPCERMQIGRNSPGYNGGGFSPVLDKCSHHFHYWIAEQYQQAFSETSI